MNRIGKRQARLLSEVGPLRLIWGRTYEDRRALKRLEARGMVRPALGWPRCWEVIVNNAPYVKPGGDDR